MSTITPAADTPTIPYTMTLPDGRTVFIALPENEVQRDHDNSLLLKPAAVRRLDQVRVLAMKTPPHPSPAYIRTLREALHLTQPAFGKRIGYSLPTVKRWEAGTLKPGQAAAIKLQELVQRVTEKGIVITPRQRIEAV